MKIRQKIIIALLAAYSAFGIIMLITTADEIEKLVWLGGIIGAIMLIGSVYIRFKLNNRPVTIPEQNGEQPGYLGSFMDIGKHLLGRFSRFREFEGTWVAYAFVWFILPLYPSGCYRVKLLSSGYGNEWAIYGSEKSNSLEVLSIYFSLYGLMLLFFSICFCLLMYWL